MIVVDASLAVKWMVREADTPAALAFLAASENALAAPDYFFVEVAGAIVRRANERLSSRADADLAIETWSKALGRRIVVGHAVTSDRLTAGSILALDLGHPLKGCLYLALAIEFGCELATCDARFARKASAKWSNVRLLGDYA